MNLRPRLPALFAAAVFSASAQSRDQPVQLLTGDPLSALRLVQAGTARGAQSRVAVSGQSFTEALRLSTAALPANTWDLRVRAAGNAPVRKDDTILATFSMRCVEPANGECALLLNVEQTVSPYAKSANVPFIAGAEWKRVRFVFRMAEDYSPGGYMIDFWMTQQVQVAEVGGISFENFGQGVAASSLGVDALYEGAAPDAPWRAAAEERIEKIRKGDLTVSVAGEDGSPVAGAAVQVRMTRHAFGWGTAVDGARLLAAGADSDKYRQFFLDNFNCAVLENDLKWPGWEANRTRALRAIEWLHANGVHKIRGHNLVWPSWQYLPRDLAALQNDPPALRKRILDHIQDEVAATRGTLMDWDVINEAFTNRDIQKILGDGEMALWFQTARDYDPDVKLFINDYNILSANGANLLHRNGYYDIIRFLDSKGAPVDGIGMQGHFSSPTAPETMLRILDRFAAFKKQIEITEFDYNTTDEELQARFTRDLLVTAFSHPAITNFLMWGFWEGQHWLPRGAMIRRDWTSKPNHAVWREMVYGKWWTRETGITGDDGTYSVRGFLGDYEIEVTAGGRTASGQASLLKEGTVVPVVLK
jgi:GH35 family endo-1,4-beta-xylanase